jgi:hypothetical protein
MVQRFVRCTVGVRNIVEQTTHNTCRKCLFLVQLLICGFNAQMIRLYNTFFLLMPKIFSYSSYGGGRPQITKTNETRIYRAWACVDENIVQ